MRIDRPHSEILSCQTRGRCEMQNVPPQRHTTTINLQDREKTDLENIENFLYKRKLVMKSQVTTSKSMHTQKSFQRPEHLRFPCAKAFEENKPHTTCSKESVRKLA